MVKGRSARGVSVDFDAIRIKEQLAERPAPVEVQAREDFVDQRLKRRARRRAQEAARKEKEAESASQETEQQETETEELQDDADSLLDDRDVTEDESEDEDMPVRKMKSPKKD